MLTQTLKPPAPELPKTGWPWTQEIPPLPSTRPGGAPWPRISIVTPSYNQGDYIEETIRSVLLQGYPNLEYIVIDGGSTDRSAAIIRKYAPWLACWVSEKDRGQSHAINKGLAVADGDIIAWLNSDDVLAPGALQRVAQCYVANPHVGFISGVSRLIDQDGQPLGEFGEKFDIEYALSRGKNTVSQPSTFMTRQALDQVGMVDESLHMAMDWDLWLRIGVKFETKFVPEIWSYFRVSPGTKTSSAFVKFNPEKLKILDKLYGSGMVPNELEKYRRVGFASVHLQCAVAYFREGSWQQAGKSLAAAFTAHPAFTLLEAARLGSRRWLSKSQ